MIYPTLTPENVTRDFIDVFGGYNHNARIGDNEFYDMENMSSSNYPLLSTRGLRGLTEYSNIPGIKGLIYKSALYFVKTNGSGNDTVLQVYKNGAQMSYEEEGQTTNVEFAAPGSSQILRTLVMMGAYLIIFPDKVYVNTADPSDNGSIEADISADSATIQLCTSDGEAYYFDVVSEKEPDYPMDGMIWLDISTEPETPKKYYAANSMWQNIPTNYFKLTIDDTTIASQLKEGDGVKISGIDAIPTDSYPIVQKIIESVDSTEIVFKGECNLTENLVSYEVADRTSGTTGNIKVWCNQNVTANDPLFINQDFTYGQQRKTCTSNTIASATLEWVDNSDVNLTSERHTVFTSTAAVAKTYFINVELWEGETLTNIVSAGTPYISIVKENGQLGQVFTVRSVGASTYVTEELISGYGVGTEFRPVKEAATDKYTTTLSFDTAFINGIKKGDKLYLSVAYLKSISNAIKITRAMPDLDFVIESKNRLWGCRYGLQGGKFVNEIYCSKLGDFKNWNSYEGISTDSYVASCGSDGKWTGAINFNGYPLFFKENHIHTVRGDYPPYNISDNPARGVKDGSNKSLAIINEVLYYHSADGICAYQGGLPTKISSALGNDLYKNAIAASYKNKYYCQMQNEADEDYSIMVFDVAQGLWHKESAIGTATDFISTNDDLAALFGSASNNRLISLFGKGGKNEPNFSWFVDTGIYGLSLPDSKYISRLNIRLSVDVGAWVIVSIEYDSSGEWERLCTVQRMDTHAFVLPIKPRRCDHFRLRLEGNGQTKIYSISKTIEQGSDKIYG